MHELDLDAVLEWPGRTVVDRNGDKVGKVGELYLDEDTDRIAYAGVRTGLFRHKEVIVPLDGIEDRDGDLVVPYDADHVRAAPSVDPDAALGDDESERLATHYQSGERTDREAEMVRSE